MTPATPNGPQDSLATVSHKGPNAKNVPDYDPKSVFNRLFTGGTTTTMPDQATKLANVRKSVLDAVLADGTNLQKKLGTADKQRRRAASPVHSRHRSAAGDDDAHDATDDVHQPDGADHRQGHQERGAHRR